MPRFLIIHSPALVLALSLTSPLVADDTIASPNVSPGGQNDAVRISAESPLVKAVSSGARKDRPGNISLVCKGRSSGIGGHGGYGGYGGGYAAYGGAPMQPISAPQVATRPVAQPVAAPAPTGPNAEVLLLNPEDDTIAYNLNGTRFDMQPGFSQKLTTRPSWVVEFDRGGSFGTARYTLTKGAYKFIATDRGWDLARHDETPAAPTPRVEFGQVARNR